MVTIITKSTATLTQENLSIVLGTIDLMVILILIGLLILKEFLNSYFEDYYFLQQESKLYIGKIIDMLIIPFLYVFGYVLLYRLISIV